MSNQQFKFVRELEQFGHTQQQQRPQSPNNRYINPQKQPEDPKLGKMVYCHFRNVKEQTSNYVEMALKTHLGGDSHAELLLPKRDQRCYYHDSSIRVYSRGGSEFIIPLLFQIEEVFPIENGIIAKVRFDRDKLVFDPLQIRKESSVHGLFGRQQQKEWTYMTITEHPLDDIHPLGILGMSPLLEGQRPQSLIQTQVEIIHASYKLPFIVMYNPQIQQVVFGLIKKREDSVDDLMRTDDPLEEGMQYIKSIEPESRHPEIFNMARDPKLVINEVLQISSPGPPTKVYHSRSIVNPYEFNIFLFYQGMGKLEVYQCDVRQIKIFRKVLEMNSIRDIVQLKFLHSSEQAIKMVSKSKAFNMASSDVRFNMSLDLRILKKRLSTLQKDILILDQSGRTLQVYQGTLHTLSIDIFPLIDSPSFDRGGMAQRGTKVDAIIDAHRSNMTLCFNNGTTKRVTMKLCVDDFIINSLLKAIKAVIPARLYESLYTDFLELIMKCNIEQSPLSNGDLRNADQLEKFTALLLAILTGDHSEFGFLVKQAPTLQQPSNQASPQPQVQQSMTPQSSQNPKNATPTQTLQTKILRSSTTSFGADSMAARRKNINHPGVQQQHSYGQMASQQMRPQVLARQASGGTPAGQQVQQKRLITTGSIGAESSNNTLTQSTGATVNQQLSANPFADLLNSDYHKNNFQSQFSSLFPPGMVLSPPVIQAPQQPSISSQTESNTSVSPTKQSSTKVQNLTPLGGQTRGVLPKSANAYTQAERKPYNPVPAQSTVQAPTSPSINVQLNFKTSKSQLLGFFNQIYSVIHLLYEDLKLNKLREGVDSPRVAKLLIKLAMSVDPYRKAAYIEYYVRDHPLTLCTNEIEQLIKKAFKDGSVLNTGFEIEQVPKIFKWLEDTLRGSSSQDILGNKYPMFFELTRKVVRVYEILNNSTSNSIIHPSLLNNYSQPLIDYGALDQLNFNKSGLTSAQFEYTDYRNYLKSDGGLHLFERVLFTIREENLNIEEIKKLPSIVSLPILEIIRYARLFQQEIQTVAQWPDSLYKLISREDILNNLRLFERKTGSNDSIGNQSKKPTLTRGFTNVFNGTNQEEIQQEQHRRDMETNIMKTAADFISAKSGGLALEGSQKQGNNKIIDFLKNRFSSDTRYKEAINFLSSSKEIVIKIEHIPNRESLTEEQMNVEKQRLLDKHFQRQLSKCIGRGALQFGTVQTLPTETLKIPKINQTGYAPLLEQYMQVEFKDEASKDILQWPEFHNGVASAIRIALSFNKNRGSTTTDINQVQHTRNWIMYHKPAEPKYEHGGFCLTMGLLGQFDTLQPTDIYQHLKSTHDATTIGILLGRAASKIGTMDDHDTRTLCIHIPYLLPPTLSLEVNLSVQSAAVIGAGLLYKGTSNRLMTEMLLAQIGRKPLSDKAIEREGYALASGIALGLVNIGIGNKMQGLIDLKLDERLLRYVEGGKIIDLPQSMLSQNFNHDNTKCSSIKEGDMVNVHITSQGALIALALIHLKSSNKSVADQLLMPQTFYSLESVRPSFLLLKVLCRNLIMWDDIKCSEDWIQNQIPHIINDIYHNDIATVQGRYQQKLIEDGIDYSTIALCYVNILAGAVMSLGFKYAGTGSREAFSVVQQYCLFFKKLKVIQPNKDSIGMVHTNLTKNQVDKNTVETCLCVSAFAMSMIMAGTGDVECFRTLRILRKRFEHDMHYGYNMAIHMSIGFLFLGSGAFTFSRSDLAIAALLCSLYPVFPNGPSDNRYHLQALRHFYVLAIESRLLQARDIDTGEFLNIEMNIEVIDEDQSAAKSVTITTPDIINGEIKSIEVKNEQYHSVSLKFGKVDLDKVMDVDESSPQQTSEKKSKVFEQFDFQRILYVKKRTSSKMAVEEQVIQFAIKDRNGIFEDKMANDLRMLNSTGNSIVEKASELNQGLLQIKDRGLEQFHKVFSNFSDQSYLTGYRDIEDVLLAQSRDTYSQLSPAEFFRIQDIYDQIKSIIDESYIPRTIGVKLDIAQCLSTLYSSDKSEFLQFMLDFKLPQGQRRSIDEHKVFHAYEEYKSGNSVYKGILQQGNDLTCHYHTKENHNINMTQARSSLIKLLTGFQTLAQPGVCDELQGLDLNEIQVAKSIIDFVLEDLRIKGQAEADIVKRYRFAKASAILIEGIAERELNQILNAALLQVFGENLRDAQHGMIDEVILPALIQLSNK